MKDMEVKMKHPIFEKVKKTSNADYEYFKQLFADASNFILNSIKLVKIPKGKQFITAEDEMDRILILLSGKVKAIEEHLSEIYMCFQDLNRQKYLARWKCLLVLRNLGFTCNRNCFSAC